MLGRWFGCLLIWARRAVAIALPLHVISHKSKQRSLAACVRLQAIWCKLNLHVVSYAYSHKFWKHSAAACVRLQIIQCKPSFMWSYACYASKYAQPCASSQPGNGLASTSFCFCCTETFQYAQQQHDTDQALTTSNHYCCIVFLSSDLTVPSWVGCFSMT